MKNLKMSRIMIRWRRLLVFMCCTVLMACTEPINMVKPLNLSHAGNAVRFDFEVNKPGDYQFALLLVSAYAGDRDRMVERINEQLNLFGINDSGGQVIPVSLHLIKDGQLFLDEIINSTGTVREYIILTKNTWTETRVRNVKTLQLPAGHYSVVMTVLNNNPAFDKNRGFAQVIYANPENLKRIREENQATLNRWQSIWYNSWRLATRVMEGLYCMAFCPEPVNVYQPIDVTHAGQSVRIDFEIKDIGDYRFALLFDKGNGRNEIERRSKLFGNINNEGVAIPVSLHLIKDGNIIFNKEINATRTKWFQYFYYDNREVNCAVRNVAIRELNPGYYSVVITVLEDIPAFNGIETFFQVSAYSPKI